MGEQRRLCVGRTGKAGMGGGGGVGSAGMGGGGGVGPALLLSSMGGRCGVGAGALPLRGISHEASPPANEEADLSASGTSGGAASANEEAGLSASGTGGGASAVSSSVSSNVSSSVRSSIFSSTNDGRDDEAAHCCVGGTSADDEADDEGCRNVSRRCGGGDTSADHETAHSSSIGIPADLNSSISCRLSMTVGSTSQ